MSAKKTPFVELVAHLLEAGKDSILVFVGEEGQHKKLSADFMVHLSPDLEKYTMIRATAEQICYTTSDDKRVFIQFAPHGRSYLGAFNSDNMIFVDCYPDDKNTLALIASVKEAGQPLQIFHIEGDKEAEELSTTHIKSASKS